MKNVDLWDEQQSSGCGLDQILSVTQTPRLMVKLCVQDHLLSGTQREKEPRADENEVFEKQKEEMKLNLPPGGL